MKPLRWSEEKSRKLKRERGLSFEDVLAGTFLGIEKHCSRENQSLMVFDVDGYAWVVPYIEEESQYFLKTAFPSRKHTKIYLKGT